MRKWDPKYSPPVSTPRLMDVPGVYVDIAKDPYWLYIEFVLCRLKESVTNDIVPPKPLRVTFCLRTILGDEYCCKYVVVTLAPKVNELVL